MRYKIEFEIQPDLADTVSETVYKAIASVLGRIDEFKLVRYGGTYIGYIHEDRPIIWSEIHSNGASDELGARIPLS